MPIPRLSTLVFGLVAAPFCVAEGAYAKGAGGLPAALMCSVSEQTFVVYLSRIEPDGSAQYSGLNGGVAKVNSDGVVEPAETMKQGDCAGRTIQELREAGQVLDFAN
ncbi:hypothetical protein [Shimia abyssi]|uniref:Uncharacterized protein n=1 Tax=Shimia abyssi TaxID=1662395 RepID=A0A2P8EYI3_9RHOB|nr:hypothetical protein [Shimia abyssi]PSL14526.1 hypothetical protein CLV88_1283 [Shimia abyssi]